MLSSKFIFSEGRCDRVKRHLVFWSLWYVYFAVLHAANPFGKPEISYFRNPVFTLTESIFLVLPQIPLTYGMLYWVLPKIILKRKVALSIVVTVLLWFTGGVLQYLLISEVFPRLVLAILPERFTANTQRPPSASFFMAVLATYKGSFMIAATAMVLKFAKFWYLKEQRNLQLQKENAESQLKLLTAQVHPHFLFNTLNNIYSQTQTESPKGSKMILALSDMMRYILSDGSKLQVPLEKELVMLRDYIDLEKVRYGNKLDLHLSFPEQSAALQIAPLLLLPFIENSFKHGASKFLINPWINLKIELNEKTLLLKLMNGKDEGQTLPKSGTGLQNVKERLRFLYADKHQLHITDEKDVFVVNLRLELAEGEQEQKPVILLQPALKYV